MNELCWLEIVEALNLICDVRPHCEFWLTILPLPRRERTLSDETRNSTRVISASKRFAKCNDEAREYE